MERKRSLRVLIAKPGLDGHDKGAKIVAKGLRDSGMEVIYTGIRQTTDAIVQSTLQEGVDVIGLSILSGTHLYICQELMEKMRRQGLRETLVLVGGIIPKRDVGKLKEMGVAEVFRPGTPLDEIAQFIQGNVANRKKG